MNAQAMTERFEMRLGQSVLEELDSWRGKQDDLPSRSEAVRRLVEAGLGKGAERRIALGSGEKLIVLMLCQLFSHLKVMSDIDPAFVEAAIDGGHYWALDWEYPGIFDVNVDTTSVMSEVVDILDMWDFVERGFGALSKGDKDRIAVEAKPFGEHVKFVGFDGNHEGEHIGVARFLIERMGRFAVFKGRDLNAHAHTLDAYRRMLSIFEPFRRNLTGRDLSATEIIKILQEWRHPSRRNAAP
jgi:hypothetical protein